MFFVCFFQLCAILHSGFLPVLDAQRRTRQQLDVRTGVKVGEFEPS